MNQRLNFVTDVYSTNQLITRCTAIARLFGAQNKSQKGLLMVCIQTISKQLFQIYFPHTLEKQEQLFAMMWSRRKTLSSQSLT